MVPPVFVIFRKLKSVSIVTDYARLMLISILFWLGYQSGLMAVEEEVSFKSDYQQEVQDEEILLLQGNVEVHFRDYTVYADEVRVNDKEDEFFGVGNIRLVGADRDIYGDSIWYNYGTDDFDMRNARGSLLVSGVGEPVWFKAERLTGNINEYLMLNGRVTTCTPTEHREYHVEARSIKVLPDNKVIFRNGYFFILNVPVFWFPFWSFSLAETPWVIEVGKDNFRGVFVKTRYNYLAEELIIGSLIGEYYSREGWVAGADHKYVLPRHGTGSVAWTAKLGKYRDSKGTLYHANTYNINLQQNLIFGNRFAGNVQVASSSNYSVGRGRTNDVNGSIGLNYNLGDARTSLNINGRQTSGLTQSNNLTTGLVHNQKFDEVSSTIRFDYKINKQAGSGAADEEFNTEANFNQDMKNWNWKAVVSSHWDPDGFTYIQDRNRAYTDKLPEIRITFQPSAFPSKYRNILGFQMQTVNLTGALLYIGPEKTERNGFFGAVDTRFQRSETLSSDIKMDTSFDFWQAISSTGDAKYTWDGRMGLNWDHNLRFKSQFTWNKSDEEGRIPLIGYDRSGSPRNNLNYTFTYRAGNRHNASLSTSYALNENYQLAKGEIFSIKRLQPFGLSYDYNKGSFRVRTSTRYDAWRDDWGNISANIDWTDNKSYTLSSTIGYNPTGTFTQCSVKSTFVLGKDWDFVLDTEWARRASETIIRSVRVTHRRDCTFFNFGYDTQGEQWYITWGITAMPRASLGYSTQQQAFGPDFFNQFSGSGSGFMTGGFNIGR